MNVIQFNMVIKEQKQTIDSTLYYRATEDKKAKQVAKELAKGYMKLLSTKNKESLVY